MNIMLVSVTERTKGELESENLLGGQGTIMQQFVIEAAVTSSLGGVIGILIGCGATAVVGAAIGISATPTFSAIVISFSSIRGDRTALVICQPAVRLI